MDTQKAQNRGGFFFALSLMGFVTLVLVGATTFGSFFEGLIFDTSANPETGISIRNTTAEVQVVATVFWTLLALFAGALFTQALFRMSSITETVILSFVLSMLVIMAGAAVVPLRAAIGLPAELTNVSAFALMALFTFAFVSFLLIIAREIIVATFFTKKH